VSTAPAWPFQIVRECVSPVEPTMGELLIEGEHFSWTLELPFLNNIPGKSCIPVGTYRVVSSLSVRFKREMPRLIGVPGRVGILIHPGNVEADTEGCILLGETRIDGEVRHSRDAFERFVEWFATCGNQATVMISNASVRKVA
jgi:hypothetical protein